MISKDIDYDSIIAALQHMKAADSENNKTIEDRLDNLESKNYKIGEHLKKIGELLMGERYDIN